MHYLGVAPRGALAPGPLKAGPPRLGEQREALALIGGAGFRAAGAVEPVFHDLSLAVRSGGVLALSGPDLDAARAPAHVLAGLAPSATGGELAGRVEPAARVALVAPPAVDVITQLRPIQDVAAVFLARDFEDEAAFEEAAAQLCAVGIGADKAQGYGWELNPGEQLRMLIAAARAYRAPVLIIDQAFEPDDMALNALLFELIDAQREWGAVLWIENDLERLRQADDRVVVFESGARTRQAPPGALEPDMPTAGARAVEAPITDCPAQSPVRVRVPTLQGRQDSWWARRDARVKWLLFASRILPIYVAPDWRWMAGLSLAGLVMVLTARPSPFWLTLALLVQAPNIAGLILIPWWTGEAGSLADLEFGLRLGLG